MAKLISLMPLEKWMKIKEYLLQDKVKIKNEEIYFPGDLHHTLDFLAENLVLLTFIDFVSGKRD